MDKSRFYRSIPKVDILLEDDRIQEAIARFDRDTVMDAVREQTEFVREQIRTLDEENTLCILVDGLIPEIIRRVEKMHTPDMRPVINATGTVLQYQSGTCPDQQRAYGKAGRGCLRIFQSGVRSGGGKARGTLFPF